MPPEDNTKCEKLKVLQDEIKVLTEMVKKKENTPSVENELTDLRAQKLGLEIQIQRRLAKSSPSKDDKSVDMQTCLPPENDDNLSIRPIGSQISSK